MGLDLSQRHSTLRYSPCKRSTVNVIKIVFVVHPLLFKVFNDKLRVWGDKLRLDRAEIVAYHLR